MVGWSPKPDAGQGRYGARRRLNTVATAILSFNTGGVNQKVKSPSTAWDDSMMWVIQIKGLDKTSLIFDNIRINSVKGDRNGYYRATAKNSRFYQSLF